MLDLQASQLLPGPGGFQVAGEFFARALRPAMTYESSVPAGTLPLLLKALEAAWRTVTFAAAAMGIAIVGGIVLGFLASSSLWLAGPARGRGILARSLRRLFAIGIHGATRVFVTLIRSIHELLWAVLFLAAFGVSSLAAVVALALPCAGILAKIFSELIDEAPRGASAAVAGAGGTALQTYCFVLLPQVLPDIVAYSFYRFECALRSSAVLGFFGYPTLGFFISASFENLHYGEVWTYLYVLFALVAAVDWWSGALRRRLLP